MCLQSFVLYVNCKMLDTKARGNPTAGGSGVTTALAARGDTAEAAAVAVIRRTKPPGVRTVV